MGISKGVVKGKCKVFARIQDNFKNNAKKLQKHLHGSPYRAKI